MAFPPVQVQRVAEVSPGKEGGPASGTPRRQCPPPSYKLPSSSLSSCFPLQSSSSACVKSPRVWVVPGSDVLSPFQGFWRVPSPPGSPVQSGAGVLKTLPSHAFWTADAQWFQSCLTPCDLMDCSLPGSSVHGTLQSRIQEWVAFPVARGSSPPRDRTRAFRVSGTGRRVLYH